MKIGLNYRSYGDVGFVLYALKHGQIKADFENNNLWGKPNTTRRFEITYGDDLYIFSCDYADIADCDRKIFLNHNQWHYNRDARYDRFIISTVDIIENEFPNPVVEEFLNQGNVYLSFVRNGVKHKNFIFYPLYSLVYFYNELNLRFLNFYQNNSVKNQLVGSYANRMHIGGNPNTRRNYVFDQVSNILGEADCVSYNNPQSDYDRLLNSYRYFSKWYGNHITGYTDFSTSVCNLVFESLGSEVKNFDDKIFLTEKTLKCLLFSKENIFFMWYGCEVLIPYLKDYGFWFLNFEFYDPADTKNKETAMFNSIIKTTNYLKELKKSFGTNENVYKYLLSKFADKLEHNGKMIDQLVNHCDITDKVINLLKYE